MWQQLSVKLEKDSEDNCAKPRQLYLNSSKHCSFFFFLSPSTSDTLQHLGNISHTKGEKGRPGLEKEAPKFGTQQASRFWL